MLAWNDPSLRVTSDPPRRAIRRRLQGWWREHELGMPPGRDADGIIRNNLLPRESLRTHPMANFLAPEIAAYVQDRAPVVLAGGGTLDEDRLWRNLLSSMPMCFNLFGMLRAFPEAAGRVLAGVTGLPIHQVETIEVEWIPDGGHPLGDRTAFDAFVTYRDPQGARGFLGVETKYTEPFSRKAYDKTRYREVTSWPESGFVPGAAQRLKATDTNQLWRNSLLAVAVRKEMGFDFGAVWVVALADDPHVEAALPVFEGLHSAPDQLVRSTSLERLVSAAEAEPVFVDWAGDFTRRYLDVSVVYPDRSIR